MIRFVMSIAVLALALVLGGTVQAAEVQQVRVTADTFHLVALAERPRTVAVANPGIVDVQIVSPTQLLLNGKSLGRTSLTLFYGGRHETFEVVVQPAAVASPRPLPALTPHTVQVIRAGRPTNHQFVRDGEEWQELGASTGSPSDTAHK
jgi:Flp pilus assembly secretin CpaC